jgi:hypothetical protein
MSSKQTRNARDDNERGTSPPDDDGTGVTEHLINRDTSTDPPSRQLDARTARVNTGSFSSDAADAGSRYGGDPDQDAGGNLTQNPDSGQT